MAVSSDPGNYGEFQVLRLPKGVTINGPVQVQNLIESKGDISKELSLLRGEGSQTIQGNLLTLPVAGGLLYIEPYYVQARENAVYPTLQRVAAVFGDRIGFAPTLDEALSQVFGATSTPPSTTPPPNTTAPPSTAPPGTTSNTEIQQAIADADRAFAAGQDALRKSPPDFAAYGVAQKDLSDALNRLAQLTRTPPAASAAPAPSAQDSPPAAVPPSSPAVAAGSAAPAAPTATTATAVPGR